MEKGYIIDMSITDYETGRSVPQARLNQDGCVWPEDVGMVQVDLGRIVEVSGLVFQMVEYGPGGRLPFVTLYYSNGSRDLTTNVLVRAKARYDRNV